MDTKSDPQIHAAKTSAEAAATEQKARASARMRTASDFGTADRRVLAQAARRSRIVNLLKIALPLAAIGLIGTLAIYSVIYKPSGDIGFSFSSKGTEDNTVVMHNPRFVGTDKNSEPFEIHALKARQNPSEPSLVEMTAINGEMRLTSGEGLHLVADTGKLDTTNRILVLTGPITMTSSDGYKVTTTEAHADLQAGLLTGQQPVLAVGPFGSLNATSFEIDRDARTAKFGGRVNMHFVPQVTAK